MTTLYACNSFSSSHFDAFFAPKKKKKTTQTQDLISFIFILCVSCTYVERCAESFFLLRGNKIIFIVIVTRHSVAAVATALVLITLTHNQLLTKMCRQIDSCRFLNEAMFNFLRMSCYRRRCVVSKKNCERIQQLTRVT